VSAGAARSAVDAAAHAPTSVSAPVERTVLERLLHALNKPLTGLQCSMEVALAAPRTVEYHAQRLREGLELTERMRVLVETMREVANEEEEETHDLPQATEWKMLLHEVLQDLKPVAEAKGVRITLDDAAAASLTVKIGRGRLFALMFRMVESTVSLAEPGSVLGVETEGGADSAQVRIAWNGGTRGAEFSRAELGLLVAQAGWERTGAKWERERRENRETVTIWLSGGGADARNS